MGGIWTENEVRSCAYTVHGFYLLLKVGFNCLCDFRFAVMASVWPKNRPFQRGNVIEFCEAILEMLYVHWRGGLNG